MQRSRSRFNGEVCATARRLAEGFGLSAGRIAWLARDGSIEGEQIGRRWFISRRSLDRYLLDQELRRKSTR
jgi:hypothetical protein